MGIKKAEQPLSIYEPNELKDGYFYVYWNRATFGVRKIGGTRLARLIHALGKGNFDVN
jgi:hypothetical protein